MGQDGSPPPTLWHLVDSSLEAVIVLSTTQARFPEIQDSALTDLTMALGVGARSAAGYPGRIQERWRRSPQSLTESILGACQLDRALQAETRGEPSPTPSIYRLGSHLNRLFTASACAEVMFEVDGTNDQRMRRIPPIVSSYRIEVSHERANT
jgi:hypothetical protein